MVSKGVKNSKYHDCNEKKCYEIVPYEMFEKSCDKCDETFYIEELLEKHSKGCKNIPIIKI